MSVVVVVDRHNPGLFTVTAVKLETLLPLCLHIWLVLGSVIIIYLSHILIKTADVIAPFYADADAVQSILK